MLPPSAVQTFDNTARYQPGLQTLSLDTEKSSSPWYDLVVADTGPQEERHVKHQLVEPPATPLLQSSLGKQHELLMRQEAGWLYQVPNKHKEATASCIWSPQSTHSLCVQADQEVRRPDL